MKKSYISRFRAIYPRILTKYSMPSFTSGAGYVLLIFLICVVINYFSSNPFNKSYYDEAFWLIMLTGGIMYFLTPAYITSQIIACDADKEAGLSNEEVEKIVKDIIHWWDE
jgi:hypothetical protein